MIRWGWWLWAASRALVLCALVLFEQGDVTDLNYYLLSLRHLGEHGWAGTMSEYPLPAVAFLAVPFAVLSAAGAADHSPLAWILIMVAADLWTMRTVLRSGSAGATALWLLAVPALGPLVYCRFDLLAGLLVALAILQSPRSPRAAGAYAALATGLKYSPALVLPALLAARAGRRVTATVVVLVGAVLMAVTVMLGGVDRLFTPLRYQADRGLQIESVWASVVMVLRALDPGRYRVWFAPSKSWEISGPGVGLALALSATVTVVLVALLCWLWLRGWRAGDRSTARLVWLYLAATIAFVVSGKVLSPQYLAWLLPPAVVGVGLLAGAARGRLIVWTGVLLVAAGLTHAVWPLGYGALLDVGGSTAAITWILAMRNLLLVGLTAAAFREAFRSLRPTGSAETPTVGS